MSIKKMPKNAEKYYCKDCDFKCSKLSNYNQHLSTRKHKMLTNVDKMLTSPAEKNATRLFVCEFCEKTYKHRQSLSLHKRKCHKIVIDSFVTCEASNNIKISDKKVEIEEDTDSEVIEDITPDDLANNLNSNVILRLIHKNNKLQETLIKQQNQITELIDKVGPINNITNNNTNNINTTNNFNLNFFLNEQCKDALNIMDFIKSLQIEFSEMEYTGKHGFVEGISNIVTNAIENMEITKRPIHCTDIKRETLYIKDNEEWNKDEDKHKMKTAIDILKQNNMAKMSDWIKENPGCHSYDNPKNDLFLGMVSAHANDNEKDTKKVIKNVAKSSTIPKSVMKEQSNLIKNKKKRKTKQLETTEETDETDDFIQIIDE